MKGYRFYLEFEDAKAKREGKHNGTCVAVATDSEQSWVGWAGGIWQVLTEAIGAVFNRANSPVATTTVNRDYLRTKCKRVPERVAREIHPRLFEWLDSD